MTQKKRTIGKYRLVEELASGAFGRVYRAEDTSLKNRVVALKVMHSSHLASSQARDSFLREAQFLKMLEHPYILPILDADIEDEFPFLVTEYAPNGSLHDRLKKQAPRPLSVQEALTVLSQIAQALSYAHQRNIIHRDLKPANILFNADGDALLADFGIATVLATSMRSGTAVGTPTYMAPEQFRGMVSKEADQYALGCIAYELLTGRVPFTAPDFFALGYKHLSDKPLSPSQLNLLVPRPIEDAILTAIAKQRGDRHASVDAFMHALSMTSSSTSIFVPPSIPTVHLEMPQSGSEWVKALATDGIVKEGSVADEREGTSKGTGTMRPIHIIAREESGQPFSATASAKPSISFVERDLAAISTIATPFVTQQAGTSAPYVATPTPAWATTTNIPGSFSPTSKQSRERHHLYSSKGLVVMASLIAVLLVLLSGGIYVLLETPYPATIAAAIKTHDITKLLTLPTAQPTSKSTTSSQVIVKTPQTHGNNPTNPNQPTPQPYYASVTITPVTRTASQQFTIDAVLSTPSGSEVQARQITATNQQGFTATATGQGTTAATAATGTVTLSNTTTNSQTVPAGTSISDTNNTMNFITQQDVTVPPPASGQQSGTATVTVQAQTPGASGNIAANVISETCCTSTGGLDAVNTSAFTGGQDAQTYTYLQQSDIDSAANPVITSLESSVIASLSSQVRANEQSVGNASCTTPIITTDSPVGSQVASTNGTVSVTCTQEVYDAQGALSNAASLLQQQETHQGYTLSSQDSMSIVSASVVDSQGTVAIVVNTSATARYVFTTARCRQIAGMIAGKSASQAQSILTGMTGVASAVISLSSLDGNILPTDISHITVTTS